MVFCVCVRPQTGERNRGSGKERETFLPNIVSSSHWQLPHFSNTNGCRCWSACIRSLEVGPITAPLSLSFITQFVCTLICGLALPAHPSNTHRQTRADIYTSAHRLLAPCLYGHWDTCVVTYFARALTHLSLHSHMLPQQHTLTCVVQRMNSLMLLFHTSLSHRHHCLFFSSISFCILIFILQTLCQYA